MKVYVVRDCAAFSDRDVAQQFADRFDDAVVLELEVDQFESAALSVEFPWHFYGRKDRGIVRVEITGMSCPPVVPHLRTSEGSSSFDGVVYGKDVAEALGRALELVGDVLR